MFYSRGLSVKFELHDMNLNFGALNLTNSIIQLRHTSFSFSDTSVASTINILQL
jgi:hypothetical protein